MATERDILLALEGLPPAALDQVKDFITHLKERKAPQRPALTGQALAKKQWVAIKKWAGTNLGSGFTGRDHDAILYGSGR
jgi:hypothetical protein